ncbi:hypothetical protein NW759_002547 [Fusarium solani]|nr:hypothetical protein NW759_002547 [Fusarium solani]
MSAQNSAGIQTLLDPESVSYPDAFYDLTTSPSNTYRHLVRTKRIREARDEAKREIADYKNNKEDEYKKFEAEHSKGNQQAEDEANKEADAQIKSIQEAGKKGQAQVVKNLLNAVFEVQPVAPSKA